VDAIFVAGTTGEFPALSDAERLSVIEVAVDSAGAERVIAHVGAPSGYQAARLARAARQAGVTRMAAITPFYLPATIAGVRGYFARVCAEADGARVYAYLFPRLTGTELTPLQVAGLVNEFDLAGVKLSIPGTDFLADLARRVSHDVDLYSGNDELLVAVVAAGGRGVVSGVSPACPDYFTGLARAMDSGDNDAISRHQVLVNAAVDAIGPALSYLKAALLELGVLSSATCSLAVDPPDGAHRALIKTALDMSAPGAASRAPGPPTPSLALDTRGAAPDQEDHHVH